jgi:hypothetical protein
LILCISTHMNADKECQTNYKYIATNNIEQYNGVLPLAMPRQWRQCCKRQQSEKIP